MLWRHAPNLDFDPSCVCAIQRSLLRKLILTYGYFFISKWTSNVFRHHMFYALLVKTQGTIVRMTTFAWPIRDRPKMSWWWSWFQMCKHKTHAPVGPPFKVFGLLSLKMSCLEKMWIVQLCKNPLQLFKSLRDDVVTGLSLLLRCEPHSLHTFPFAMDIWPHFSHNGSRTIKLLWFLSLLHKWKVSCNLIWQ